MTLTPRELPTFVRIDRAGRSVEVHPDFEPYFARAISEDSGFRPAGLKGRGEIASLETPHGTVLVRPCLRGGKLRSVLRDRYVLINRPLREIETHCEAYRRGVATVLPVAAVWSRSGPFFSGSVATLKADATDLLRLFESGDKPADADLVACGRAIHSMHAAGILHADLNLANLLVHGGEAWVIDFDKARFVSEVGVVHARENFLRLKRSFQKREFPIAYFDTIRDTYESLFGASLGAEKFHV